jgi:hypothetical protein
MTIFSPSSTGKKPYFYYTTSDYSENTDESGCSLRNQWDEYVFARKGLEPKNMKDFLSKDLSYVYYVRIDNGKIYDPRTTYSLSDNKPTFIEKVCKDQMRWIKVNESAFNSYLEFLKIGSDQHFKAASKICFGI